MLEEGKIADSSAISMYRDVDDEGELTYDPDELSGDGTAGPASEGEWEESPAASPEPEFFKSSAKLKPRKRLVRKSVAEDSSRLEDLDEGESRPSKRKGKELGETDDRKRVRKVRDGREGNDRDGGGADSKIGKVGSTSSKLAKLARNGGKGSSDRAAGSDRLSRGRDHREESSPWEDPGEAAGSEVCGTVLSSVAIAYKNECHVVFSLRIGRLRGLFSEILNHQTA